MEKKRKKLLFSLIFFNILLYPLKSYPFSFMNILQKTAAEKTKRESEAPSLSSRYTDSVHREKTNTKELTSSILFAAYTGMHRASRQKNILPPSKSDIGRRLSTPKKRELAKNILIISPL